MDQFTQHFQEFWQQVLQSFSTSSLQVGLMIGSGLLAVALLVLALTRWGQSRPIWKCVILSFAAHILLLGYGYGTRLMFDTPVVVQESETLRVNLVDEVGKSLQGEQWEDAAISQDWDQFVNQQPLPPVENLDRPLIDSEVVIERLTQETPHPNDADKKRLALELPERNLNEADPTDFQPIDQPNITANDSPDFEMPQPQLESPEIEIARRGDIQRQLEMPDFDPAPELPPSDLANDLPAAADPKFAEPSLADTMTQPEPSFIADLLSERADLPSANYQVPSPPFAPPANDFKPLKPLRAPNHLKLVSSNVRLGDGQAMPKVYSLRKVKNRTEVAQRRGGSLQTEKAVNAALHWLSENQESDGSWDPRKTGAGNETKVFGHDRKGAGADADCGITGLATLAFLGAGHTHLEGPYQSEIKNAIEYLARQQTVDGNLSGDARLFAKMYCHSISLLALSEALALTGDHRLLPIVQRGVDFSIKSQNRRDGGWRYQPGDSGDMSQFGWQVLALHSAELGGVHVPRKTKDGMNEFLKKCSRGAGGGLASYRPGQGPSTTMTAEALMCRYFLKQDVSTTTLMEASRQIATERPTPHHVNLYYWYYGTLAMYHAGGDDWDQWNSAMKRTLLELQETAGNQQGSWAADGVWGSYGGRVYSTAMATLSLEVYYRYLPMADVAQQKTRSYR